LHSIYLYHHDPKMKYFYDRAAAHVFIDGMPIILWGWLMGYPLRPSHRFTGVDWFFPFMARAAKEGWRVFYLGNRPGIAETGAQRFRAQHPDLLIKTQHGFFEPGKETDAVIAQINAYAPDVLLVGMGMPRQEHWILDYHAQLQVKCIITVGATMDYFAGAIPIPPRWMGQVGLEWLARLWAEPRRLARRYLIEPWSLLPYMVADVRQRLKR
jgi:N-acetylglucosaminyldiphosphoundecaprenol N-acetyl-beta-D-mannosaminyltransferase